MNNTVFILKDIFYLVFILVFLSSLKTFENHKFKFVAMISNNVKLLIIKRLSIFIKNIRQIKSTVYMKYINYSTKRVET